MLRTAERVTDDLDAWRKKNEPHITVKEDAKLGKLLHELRALEKGHESRSCEECEHYDIDQLTGAQRIAQADMLRVRMLTEGYPLVDVPRPTYESIRQSLIAGTRYQQICTALGWTDQQILDRLWKLFPDRMQRTGKNH